VIDDEAPEVTCPANITVSNDVNACNADIIIPAPVFVDECGIASVVNNYNNSADASDNYPVGTTTIEYTITDIHGNVSTCTFDVTVIDDEAPQVTCPANITVSNDANACNAFVTVPAPSVDDECGIASVVNNYNNTADASDTYPVGTTTVEFTITDIHGNITTCTFDVTVLDDEAPEVTCPSDITIFNDLGACNAGVTVPSPSVNDECGIASIVNNYNNTADASDIYPVGTTTIEFTVTDIHGNITTCTFNVTVIDNEIPAMVCPADQTVIATSGECGTDVIVEIPTATDNCEVLSIVNDYTNTNNASDYYPVGETIVTWTTTDIHGNEFTCTTTITVVDTEAPSLVCPSDVTADNTVGACGTDVVVDLPIVDDNCGIATVVNNYNGTDNASDNYPVGITLVEWTVTDIHGNVSTCTTVINIIDAELPTITCPENITVFNDLDECSAIVTVPTPVSSDNCGVQSVINNYNGTTDATDTYPVGTTVITWTVTDINGNSTTCEMLIEVVDNQVPVITCPTDLTVNNDLNECGAVVNYDLPTFTDNCPGSTITLTSGPAVGEFFPLGTTLVAYQVTDASGNTLDCSFNVTVVDNELPQLTCPGDIQVGNQFDSCGAFVTYPIPQYFDNCTSGEATLIDGPASGEYFEVGITQVTYEVIDESGNISTCTFNVEVLDIQSPVSTTCPGDIVQVDPIVTYNLPIFTDNCSWTMSLTQGLESGDVFPHGITQVTYTAVDPAGNTTECTFFVTVNTPPVGVDDDEVFAEEDVSITIDVLDNDFDLDGDSLFVSNASAIHGQIIINEDGTITYINDPTVFCGMDTITYVVCDQFNACDTALVFVDVECYIDLIIPEGFSPNGDGVNDSFTILGLEDYPNNKLTVFNRWGHKVFEATNYQNDWAGYSQSALTLGSGLLPKGTYFYVLDLGTGDKPRKGYVFLNK
jgi:gliding motility-associated-like protein